MPVDRHSIEFLDALERAEARLLAWGVVDGFFSEPEIERRADDFLAELTARRIATSHSDGWDMVEGLLDARLLWRVPETTHYRTRMAEAVRLTARLRQIFSGRAVDAWRHSANLVADYRLLLRPRTYPRRNISVSEVSAAIRREAHISPLQESVILGLLNLGNNDQLQLSGFQVRAAARILRPMDSNRTNGTIICSGTGSGKTLAFYLPAYTAIVPSLSANYWTKCLAIYPRNELLKDQLREALANARRIEPAIRGVAPRGLVLGAFYGDTPASAKQLTSGPESTNRSWTKVLLRDAVAYECPFIRCPRCSAKMAWLESDARQELERLVCVDRDCTEEVTAGEIRLTRERMLLEPPDVLFTTTEMMNQRMASGRYARLFGIGTPPDRRPRFVLLDEVHTYEGVHGAHVALLLRRWRRLAQTRVHIVGLSATLADAGRFFAELAGIGHGDVAEISPQPMELESEGTEYMMAVRGDPSSATSLLSTTIQTAMLLRRVLAPRRRDAHYGNRVFTFTDNLDVINRLFYSLLDAEGWIAPGRPDPKRPGGSLANLRAGTLPQSRERFHAGQNWVLVEDIGNVLAPGARMRVGRTSSQDAGVDPDADIVVATASLEVGFDDPDVGAMLQHKAPHSSAAFLQRKGRAGRRRGTRPWTVVVLSDYGRDRSAYQAYDQLFSPYLPPRHLPLGNRVVLRMQATYSLLDFLARSLPSESSPDAWADLSYPVDLQGPPWEKRRRDRQLAYAQRLRSLLHSPAERVELIEFLERSLGVDEDTITALLWEPPRGLLIEAIPTLLRRLERNWTRASGSGYEHYTRFAPLPEFVPRALFSDLNLPEVAVRIPDHGQGEGQEEMMPLAQGLREFAPGRISRRFGVTHARIRYWVDPGEEDELLVNRLCPAESRQELGRFLYQEDGQVLEAFVFRPFAINVSVPPEDVQQSSNAFLEWRTQFVPTEEGFEIDLPDGTAWSTVLKSLRIHTHELGIPIEARRFATGAFASVARGRGRHVERAIRFVCDGVATTREQAAIGFAADVDAVHIRFDYPPNLRELCAADARLMRGLRPARFHYLVRTATSLDGTANHFERDWLARAYLSSMTVEALRSGYSLQAAEAALSEDRATISAAKALETILQWAPADTLEDNVGGAAVETDAGEEVRPRRLRELTALLELPEVRSVLHEAAKALWESVDHTWDPWLRTRFKITLAGALSEAVHALCPRIEADALLVDLDVIPGTDDTGTTDDIWLAEATIGGGGFVEEFLRQYAADPRRYLRLLDAALGPSDLEWIGEELQRILDYLAAGTPESVALSTAFDALRTSQSHEATVQALVDLRRALAQQGFLATPGFLVSLNTRLLRPGTTPRTDDFFATCVREWTESEERLGIEIDARIFSLVEAGRSRLETALQILAPGDSETARAAWRHGVLCGVLWPRGARVRHESLRTYNPFADHEECDRLIVLAGLPRHTLQVQLSSDDWFEELEAALAQRGVAELRCLTTDSGRLADALLRVACQPIDSGDLLVYARAIGVRRDVDSLVATLELPEAFQ